MSTRARRVASWAALAALVGAVAVAAFLAAREDDPAAAPTTTSSTTTTVDEAAVAAAVARALQADLSVAVTDEEAACVANGLVALVPPATLVQLVERPEPLTGVPPDVRDQLVQLVVRCLPEGAATALLGSDTTTTTLGGLPDEG